MADENNKANEPQDFTPELERNTPQEFVMGNGEKTFASSFLKPKMPQRFSKRIVIILGVVCTMIFLVIGMAARTPAPRSRNAEKEQTPLRMSNAESAIDITKRVEQAYSPPQPQRRRTEESQQPQREEGVIVPGETERRDERKEETDKAALEAEREREQQRLALSRQWLDLQREAFLSTPATSGGNWIQTAQSAETTPNSSQSEAGARREEHDRRRERYLNSYGSAGASGTERAQTEKEQFFNARNSGRGVLSTMAQAPISPFIIPSGTLIPCNLVMGINSDLPGYVVAQVSENVCDWKNPDIILIPQGTRVFGKYDSKIAFAQRRVQVSWSRLIYPDGTTLDLQGMPAADKKGYSGLSDKYYPRYGRMLTAAIMTAAFSSVGLLFDDSGSDYDVVSVDGSTVLIPKDSDARDEFAREVAETIGDAGEKLFDKYLNASPTILIRPAKRFSIVVNADIPFFSSYGRVR